MSRSAVEVSVVIPCYNEGGLLNENFKKLCLELNSLDRSFEVLFVDDNSQDNTCALIKEICKAHPFCSALYNEENIGRGATFMKGADHSNGNYVGFLDIDLEVSASFLPDVILALDQGADIASVYREYKLRWQPIFLLRAVLSSVYKRLVRWYLKLPLKDTETGFKFFRRKAYADLRRTCKSKHWFWDTEVMALAYWSGYDIQEVKGEFIKNVGKKSTVRIIPDTLSYIKELKRFKGRMKNRS
jgi:glycosyltransferase AglD